MQAIGALSYAATAVDPTLIFWYDFGNSGCYPGIGTVVTDLSGNSHTGTISGAPVYDAIYGGLLFTGTQDIANNAMSINAGQDFTVSAWFNTTYNGAGGLVAPSYPYLGAQGWSLFLRATSNIALSIGQDVAYAFSTNVIVTNTWYNITATVTGGGTAVRLYLNGVEMSYGGTSYSAHTIDYTTTPQFQVAHYTTNFYIGELAITKVWNRVLSGAEITTEFNTYKTRFGL